MSASKELILERIVELEKLISECLKSNADSARVYEDEKKALLKELNESSKKQILTDSPTRTSKKVLKG